MGHLFRSLKARLFLLVVLAMAPAVGLMVYSASEQRGQAVVDAQQGALAVARSIAHEHQRWVDSTQGLLRVLSELPVVRGDDEAACRETLLALLEANPAYTVLGVTSVEGLRVCSTLTSPAPVDARLEPWFQEVIQTGRFTVGEFRVGAVTGDPVIVFAQPILEDDGTVQRIIIASLNLNWVETSTAETILPPASSMAILDGNGTLIARHPDQNPVGQNLAHVPGVAYAISQTVEGVAPSPLRGIDGETRLYAVVPFGGQHDEPAFRVTVSISEAEAYASANAVLRRNLTALGVLALAGLVASWAIGDRFVFNRVRRLVGAAQQIGVGDFTARTQVPHDDSDFGRVAVAFDQMAASLETREAERAQAEQQRMALAREQAARAALEAGHRRRTILYNVSKTLLDTPSMEAAAPVLLQEIAQRVGAEAVVCWTVDRGTARMALQATWQSRESLLGGVGDHPPTHLTRHGGTESEAIGLEDVQDAPYLEHARAQGMRWLIRVPLEARGGSLGYMEFLCRDLPQESQAMLQALTTVGRHIGQFMERREAEAARAAEEERVRALVETTPASVIVVDAASGRLLHINQEWERMSGVDRGRMVTVEDLRDIAVRRKPDGTEYKLEELPIFRALRHGERVFAEEIHFEFPDARRVPTLVSAAPVRDESGNVTAAVLVAQDITKLQEIERLRSDFLGMVSHELRTPLAIVKMTADGAFVEGEAPSEEENREAFRIIGEQADRLLGLVSNLRDVAQVEAGAFAVAPQQGRLEPLLGEVVEAMQRTTQTRIQVELPPGLPVVSMDPQRVRQVLQNLLHNAVKFSPPDMPVRVSVEALEGKVAVHVSNTGSGIPVSQQPYLFRKFSQLRDTGGTGLGLAISKGIVEAHGGRIWVDSTEDAEVTTFSFTLPTRVLSSGETGANGTEDYGAYRADTDVSRPTAEQDRRTRVLIVDDEPLIVKHLSRILVRAGYEAVGVTHPEQVLPAVQDAPPDLVLLDLRLPGTDGFEVFEKLRIVSTAPVLFLSAGAQESDKDRALAMGARDYLVKPVSPDDLLERIAEALSGTFAEQPTGPVA